MTHKGGPPHTWTDERRERVKLLWQNGLSASQIKDDLGQVTRNAVIGIINRAGLTRGKKARRTVPKSQLFITAAAINRNREARKFDPPKPEPVVPNKVKAAEPVSLCVALIDLKPRHCRWPSENEPTTFCGARAPEDGVYCEHHAGRAYQVPVARRHTRKSFSE